MTIALEASGLTVTLSRSGERPVRLLEDVSIDVPEGRIVGLAGESGCGKSMTARTILGLLPPGCDVVGSIRFQGEDVLRGKASWRALRGRKIALVSQDPMNSLHPMMTIGAQLTEHYRHHMKVSRKEARQAAIQMLDDVRIPRPETALRAHPGQFSGGMLQRVCIAMALICRPSLLIADEPTTALDVTVQAGILELLDSLSREYSLSVLFISHDLSVLAALSQRLYVMYAGRVIEEGPTGQVLATPAHPYTRALLNALPTAEGRAELRAIPGMPPSPELRPEGCYFRPRCEFAVDECSVEHPTLRTTQHHGGSAACFELDRLGVES